MDCLTNMKDFLSFDEFCFSWWSFDILPWPFPPFSITSRSGSFWPKAGARRALASRPSLQPVCGYFPINPCSLRAFSYIVQCYIMLNYFHAFSLFFKIYNQIFHVRTSDQSIVFFLFLLDSSRLPAMPRCPTFWATLLTLRFAYRI